MSLRCKSNLYVSGKTELALRWISSPAYTSVMISLKSRDNEENELREATVKTVTTRNPHIDRAYNQKQMIAQ